MDLNTYIAPALDCIHGIFMYVRFSCHLHVHTFLLKRIRGMNYGTSARSKQKNAHRLRNHTHTRPLHSNFPKVAEKNRLQFSNVSIGRKQRERSFWLAYIFSLRDHFYGNY